MTEEQPINSSEQSGSPEETKKTPQSKLDLLPDKIKRDLHALIAAGNGGMRVKKALEDRYLKDTGILPVDMETYNRYIRIHRKEIMEEAALAKKLVDSSKEDIKDLKELSDTTTSITLDNRSKALEKIFDRVQTRLSLLEKTQGTYPNPHYEQLIGAYLKEMRTIVEKILHNKEAFERDNTQMIYDQLENALGLFLTSVVTLYKKLHTEDSKFEEFRDLLKDEMPNILRNFKSGT